MLSEVLLTDYQYDLPDERIARYPVEPRDTSKLMVFQNQTITHSHFYHLADYLPNDSFLVFNDTKVIPARVIFSKPTGATIEIFLLHPEQPTRIINDAMQLTDGCVWSCMVGNKKRWKVGEILSCALKVANDDLRVTAEWIDYEKNWVKLSWSSLLPNTPLYSFVEVIKALGEIPLPPYLNRKTESQDLETYQTVYSQVEGAVAAPTAGLHFTEQVFDKLSQKGIAHGFVTLHVGAGTFQPVKVRNAIEHDMHAEQVVFSKKLIEQLLENIGTVVAVGTTSMRSLESLYWVGATLCSLPSAYEGQPFFIEKLTPYHDRDYVPTSAESLQAILNYMAVYGLEELIGETEIMIFPSYDFKLVKGLITNYHQPNSTLMLLVAAFVGEQWRTIYNEALNNGYRFLSYGDSSLLLR